MRLRFLNSKRFSRRSISIWAPKPRRRRRLPKYSTRADPFRRGRQLARLPRKTSKRKSKAGAGGFASLPLTACQLQSRRETEPARRRSRWLEDDCQRNSLREFPSRSCYRAGANADPFATTKVDDGLSKSGGGV